MKKYLIVFMILFILMGVFSMDILGRSITDIQRRMVGQTDYRINVVKGIVESENINQTYNCYIAGESVIYPNIPTFSRNPKLQPGDQVTIEFINGCRETPAILAPEDIREVPDTTLISAVIFVVFSSGATYYIKGYDTYGILISTWTIETTESIGNALTVDTNSNVYTITGDQRSIKKRNSSGTLTLTKTETNYIYGIAAGSDGYIYTYEYDSAFNNGYISKRNASDLISIGTKIVDAGGIKTYYGFTIDSDNDFYLMNSSDNQYEKWDWTTGLVASQATGHDTFSSLATVGTKLANIHWLVHAITLPKNLGGAETDKELDDIGKPGALGSIGSDFLVSGYTDANEFSIGKYDSSLIKIWTIKVGAVAEFSYGSIAAYPF